MRALRVISSCQMSVSCTKEGLRQNKQDYPEKKENGKAATSKKKMGASFSQIIEALEPFDLQLNKMNLHTHFKKHFDERDRLKAKIWGRKGKCKI